jgi:hypothetical protein
MPTKRVYFVLCLMIALAIFSGALIRADQGDAVSREPSTQTLADLDPNQIYLEAKERGVDLLSRKTDRHLREAFVTLHAAADESGSQLVSEDKPWTKAAREVSSGLSQTKLVSTMMVRTITPGAQIKYKLIGDSRELTAGRLTNSTSEQVVIGLYHVWAERNGHPSSSEEVIYRVIRPEVIIDLAEQAGPN